MFEIGGFLDLSANWPLKEIAHRPVLLNTARNCIRYLAQQREIRRILVPYYSCHTVVRALQQDGVEIDFYFLNEEFLPDFSGQNQDEYFIYVNYYGLMDENVQKLSVKYPNLIVDNSQAFFAKPVTGVDTVSSPRKFFGLPDGGLLYPGRSLKPGKLSDDKSAARMLYLAKRLDEGSQAVYRDSVEARESLENYPIRRMSLLTQYLLSSLDLKYTKSRRLKNWHTVDASLGPKNTVKLTLEKEAVPIFYPYFCTDRDLRAYLVSKDIFVGTYWPGVIDIVPSDSVEARLVNSMIPLPIDQRYDSHHMQYMLDVINSFQTGSA